MNEDRLECEKKEMILGINAFDQPAEASGTKAWGNLISNLLFMTPGTIPSDPEMGCDIAKYEFEFIDNIIDELQEKIEDQITTYLPDIPLESIMIRNGGDDGEPNVLYITISFTIENEDNVVAVAAEKINSIINFAVV